jgi:hypothetical protein
LPKIVDEAPETPNWVPALGVGIFAVITILLAIRFAWVEANPVAAGSPTVQAAAAVEPAP